jgi:hypothetical protein
MELPFGPIETLAHERPFTARAPQVPVSERIRRAAGQNLSSPGLIENELDPITDGVIAGLA